MNYLLVTVYIVVSTYYLVGILTCYDCIVKREATLRFFLKQCKPAALFACIMILVISYMWPIGLIVRPYIMVWFQNNIKPRKRRSANEYRRSEKRILEAA